MILAGFDIATRTGCAIDDGSKITTYTFKAKAKRPIGLKQTEVSIPYEAKVALEFRQWCRSFLIAHGVERVGYEQPADRAYERTKTIVEPGAAWAGQSIRKEKQASSSLLTLLRANILAATLDEVCQSLGIPTEVIPAGDWRKSFLGMARAPKSATNGRDYLKEQAKLQAKRLGVEVKNDDESDAVGVVFHLRGILFPQRFAAADSLFNLPPSRVGSSATASV